MSSPRTNPLRVLYFGTYRAEYSRNRIQIAALRRADVEVAECHLPLWKSIEERVDAVSGGWARPGFLLRLLTTYLQLIVRYLRMNHDYDLIVCGYPGQFDVYLAWLISRIERKPLVWDVFMSTWLIARERGLQTRSSFSVNALYAVEWLALRLPHLLIQDTKQYVDWFSTNFGIPAHRFALVPTGADSDHFRPADASTHRRTDAPTTDALTHRRTDALTTDALTTDAPTTDAPTTDALTHRRTDALTHRRTDAPTTDAPTADALTHRRTDVLTTDAPTTDALTHQHTILYSGTYIPNHDAPTIVRAAALLRQHHAIRFLMIGDGPQRAECAAEAQRLALPNLHFVDWLSQDDLKREIAAADLCLGAFGNTPQSRMTVQNKIYECLAMGKPVLTGASDAIADAFVVGMEVAVCKRRDPQALADAILALVADPELRARLAANGAARFQRDYTIAALGERYRDHLLKLLAQEQGG